MTPVDLRDVVLTALLNPAVIVVAFWMGRSADQWQKLPVAAFAAALAGFVVLFVGTLVGISPFSAGRPAPAGDFFPPILFRPGLGLFRRPVRPPRPVPCLPLWSFP